MAQANHGSDVIIVGLASGISFLFPWIPPDPGPLHRHLFLAIFTSLPAADPAAIAGLASLFDRVGAFDCARNPAWGSYGPFLLDVAGGRTFTQNAYHDSRFFHDGSLVLSFLVRSAVAGVDCFELSVGVGRRRQETIK